MVAAFAALRHRLFGYAVLVSVFPFEGVESMDEPEAKPTVADMRRELFDAAKKIALLLTEFGEFGLAADFLKGVTISLETLGSFQSEFKDVLR
jgi:hypothetical protein